MSQENVEVVRQIYEAWNRRDVEGVLHLLDPEIEWKLPEAGINPGAQHGHQGVRDLVDSYFESFERFRIEPEKFFETPDRIVVFIRAAARGRESGVDVEVRPAHVWTMRAGKAARLEVFVTWDSGLEAVGLSG